MNKPITDIEMNFIQNISGGFKRHPFQINNIFEADAEIIDFKNQHPDYLIFKTDGIKEEIAEGLYEDPYLIGWMAVTITVSDLAAVGSVPLGILLNLNIPDNPSEKWIQKFQSGINEACYLYNIPVLGGDTNFDPSLSISSTGIATISGKKPMMRKTIQPGDLLYATGKFGQGNAYAYSRLFNNHTEIDYRPIARLKECWKIQEFATACIDTSDGVFPALSVLCNLNQIGVNIKNPIQQLLCNRSSLIYKTSPIPAWMFLAGPHGEYELIFSIPQSSQKEFELFSLKNNLHSVFLGEVIQDKKIKFITESMNCIRGKFCSGSSASIRNGMKINSYVWASIGNWDWRNDFGQINLPVLVITGNTDINPVEAMQEWDAAFPNSKLVLIDGAGHYPQVEKPLIYFENVRAFLR